MADTKASQEHVDEICDELYAKAENITLRRVREVLGGGAHSTISTAIEDWRERKIEQNRKELSGSYGSRLERASQDFLKELLSAAGKTSTPTELIERIEALEDSNKEKDRALDKQTGQIRELTEKVNDLLETVENIGNLTLQGKGLQSETNAPDAAPGKEDAPTTRHEPAESFHGAGEELGAEVSGGEEETLEPSPQEAAEEDFPDTGDKEIRPRDLDLLRSLSQGEKSDAHVSEMDLDDFDLEEAGFEPVTADEDANPNQGSQKKSPPKPGFGTII